MDFLRSHLKELQLLDESAIPLPDLLLGHRRGIGIEPLSRFDPQLSFLYELFKDRRGGLGVAQIGKKMLGQPVKSVQAAEVAGLQGPKVGKAKTVARFYHPIDVFRRGYAGFQAVKGLAVKG